MVQSVGPGPLHHAIRKSLSFVTSTANGILPSWVCDTTATRSIGSWRRNEVRSKRKATTVTSVNGGKRRNRITAPSAEVGADSDELCKMNTCHHCQHHCVGRTKIRCCGRRIDHVFVGGREVDRVPILRPLPFARHAA